ncbi:MAG: pseudouridine synthase [Gemmatimonadota bacterium]
MTEPMRIHRALARAGVASRRHAETLIAEGRVTVNGAPAKVGQSVDPARDRVQVDGRDVVLEVPRARWFVLHKPAGVMTTRRDPEGRRTVFDLVPDVPGLTYVGRLDFLTEGVLLLTTDGEAAHRLTHPSAEVERVYLATVRGNAKKAAEEARSGVELEDGVVTPAWVNVYPLEHRRWGFELAIREGRTREVRRLCAALGLEVEHLVRTQFGPVRIGQLEPGQWRELSPREAAMLEVVTGTEVPAGKPPKRRDDRVTRGSAASSRGERTRGGSTRGGGTRGGVARGSGASARPARGRRGGGGGGTQSRVSPSARRPRKD